MAEFFNVFHLYKEVVSTAYETIGIAAMPNGNCVNVLLFNQEGELKMNSSIQYDIHVGYLALRNYPKGGFVLFVIGAEEIRQNPSWKLNVDMYYLTKVDADGNVVGSIKMKPEPNCRHKHRSGLGLQVFQNEAGEHCIVVVCSLFFNGIYTGLTSNAAQLDQLVKCFTDEDFFKSQSVV